MLCLPLPTLHATNLPRLPCIRLQLLCLPTCPLPVRMQLRVCACCCALSFASVLRARARACMWEPPITVPRMLLRASLCFRGAHPCLCMQVGTTHARAPACSYALRFAYMLCALARACRWGPPMPASLPACTQRPPAPLGTASACACFPRLLMKTLATTYLWNKWNI
jgi:hypothetical protein